MKRLLVWTLLFLSLFATWALHNVGFEHKNVGGRPWPPIPQIPRQNFPYRFQSQHYSPILNSVYPNNYYFSQNPIQSAPQSVPVKNPPLENLQSITQKPFEPPPSPSSPKNTTEYQPKFQSAVGPGNQNVNTNTSSERRVFQLTKTFRVSEPILKENNSSWKGTWTVAENNLGLSHFASYENNLEPITKSTESTTPLTFDISVSYSYGAKSAKSPEGVSSTAANQAKDNEVKGQQKPFYNDNTNPQPLLSLPDSSTTTIGRNEFSATRTKGITYLYDPNGSRFNGTSFLLRQRQRGRRRPGERVRRDNTRISGGRRRSWGELRRDKKRQKSSGTPKKSRVQRSYSSSSFIFANSKISPLGNAKIHDPTADEVNNDEPILLSSLPSARATTASELAQTNCTSRTTNTTLLHISICKPKRTKRSRRANTERHGRRSRGDYRISRRGRSDTSSSSSSRNSQILTSNNNLTQTPYDITKYSSPLTKNSQSNSNGMSAYNSNFSPDLSEKSFSVHTLNTRNAESVQEKAEKVDNLNNNVERRRLKMVGPLTFTNSYTNLRDQLPKHPPSTNNFRDESIESAFNNNPIIDGDRSNRYEGQLDSYGQPRFTLNGKYFNAPVWHPLDENEWKPLVKVKPITQDYNKHPSQSSHERPLSHQFIDSVKYTENPISKLVDHPESLESQLNRNPSTYLKPLRIPLVTKPPTYSEVSSAQFDEVPQTYSHSESHTTRFVKKSPKNSEIEENLSPHNPSTHFIENQSKYSKSFLTPFEIENQPTYSELTSTQVIKTPAKSYAKSTSTSTKSGEKLPTYTDDRQGQAADFENATTHSKRLSVKSLEPTSKYSNPNSAIFIKSKLDRETFTARSTKESSPSETFRNEFIKNSVPYSEDSEPPLTEVLDNSSKSSSAHKYIKNSPAQKVKTVKHISAKKSSETPKFFYATKNSAEVNLSVTYNDQIDMESEDASINYSYRNNDNKLTRKGQSYDFYITSDPQPEIVSSIDQPVSDLQSLVVRLPESIKLTKGQKISLPYTLILEMRK